MLDAKAMEKRLQHYGEGEARDKFGKKTNQQGIQAAKAVPLAEMDS